MNLVESSFVRCFVLKGPAFVFQIDSHGYGHIHLWGVSDDLSRHQRLSAAQELELSGPENELARCIWR